MKEQKRDKMEDLKRVQSIVRHATELMSIYATKKLAEMEVVTVFEDIDPAKKDVIKAYLAEIEDDIIETNPGAK